MGVSHTKIKKYYHCSSGLDEEKMVVAHNLGFQQHKNKLKIKRGDVVLVIGKFNYEVLHKLPSSLLIVVEENPILTFQLHEEEKLRNVRCMCIRVHSNYDDFIYLLSEAVRSYNLYGHELRRIFEMLDYKIQNICFTQREKAYSPSFSVETNNEETYSYKLEN